LELAFSSDEEETLHTYCLNSESPVAQNFLFMYYLSRNNFREAIEIHYQILFDKKRDQIVEKLMETLPNLRNEISNSKRNVIERVGASRKEVAVDDEQSVIMVHESEESTANSLQKLKNVDESLLSFKIVSQNDSLQDISETSEIITGSTQNSEHDDESSSINDEIQRQLFDRYDINIVIFRQISNSEDSDYETRSISPIPPHSICLDADSVIMTTDFSSDIRNSGANLTPLASVLKEDSIRDVAETPKAKITIIPSLKNISPFHHVVDPPKTGNNLFF
jgi:hypothetical protein